MTPGMAPETAMGIACEIRDALEKLTAELKSTRVAVAAVERAIKDMMERDDCEFSPGYTCVRREMN